MKCENFQKGGAFKARGAMNTVLGLPDSEAAKGVVTHSSGNHGAALALAARIRGIPATVVMPANSTKVKKDAVADYGARIEFCAPTMAERDRVARKIRDDTGGVLVHPFNDHRIICGQGTAALELLEDVADLDVVIVPVGGGGLLAGTLIAAKELKPSIRVLGAEPEQADDAFRSWKAGRLVPARDSNTVADGLRAHIGDVTFPIIAELVDEIVLVSEDEIIRAMRSLWERAKLVVEPSGAVPLAALLGGRCADLRGKSVGLILSGGNVDLGALAFGRGKSANCGP